MKELFNTIMLFIYKHTFCRDYRHCIGLCGHKWTQKEKDEAIARDYALRG
jgi:hypothetical protein